MKAGCFRFIFECSGRRNRALDSKNRCVIAQQIVHDRIQPDQRHNGLASRVLNCDGCLQTRAVALGPILDCPLNFLNRCIQRPILLRCWMHLPGTTQDSEQSKAG